MRLIDYSLLLDGFLLPFAELRIIDGSFLWLGDPALDSIPPNACSLLGAPMVRRFSKYK
jgi:hypothetical protein